MPFERPDLLTIKGRIEKGIESRLFSNIALLTRAVLRLLARVFAGAIHTNYGHVDFIKDQVFIVTAELEFLLRIGREYGISPIAASFASGTVHFTGVESTNVPTGTLLVDDDGIEYGTLSGGDITGGVLTVEAQAVEPGANANKIGGAGIFLTLIQPISGIDNDVNVDSTDITGGVDAETTEAFRERLLFRRRNPPMGGNAADYEAWSKSVSGVKRAWVYPGHAGLGTVFVAVIQDDVLNPAPPAGLITDVQNFLNSVAPVTAAVTVVSTTDIFGIPGHMDFSLTIKISPDEIGFRDAIEKNLRNLLEPNKPGSEIAISQINTAIGSSGVDTHEITQIFLDGNFQDPTENLFSENFTYAVLGNISYI